MTTETGSGGDKESRPRTAAAPRDGRESSRGFGVLLVVTFLAFVDYAALLPVVPLWAASGGAGSVAVGATTGVMMAATVATQAAVPRLFEIAELRTMVVLGAVLLGAPTPLYLLSAEPAPILAITVLRGVGFALVVTAGATLVADLAAAGRLSSAASRYGVAAALPNLAALAGGVWAAHAWGFTVVFWAATIACLAGALQAVWLPAGRRGRFRFAAAGDAAGIGVPIVLFLVTAASFGAVTTFVPVAAADPATAFWALLAASAGLVCARLAAGAFGDRYGAGRLLPFAVLCCAAGLGLLGASLDSVPGVPIAGAALLGAGFGACQNDSFVLTLERLGRGRSGTASTIWNIAYDGGLGAGAVALGWLAGGAGYARAYLVMAVVVGVLALALFRLPGGRVP